jgi:hypothetical protein
VQGYNGAMVQGRKGIKVFWCKGVEEMGVVSLSPLARLVKCNSKIKKEYI